MRDAATSALQLAIPCAASVRDVARPAENDQRPRFLTLQNSHATFVFSPRTEKPFVTTPATAEIRKTALNAVHRSLGAKMVNFGGWDMPLEYSGILSEHEAMRTRAGLFDVSHMGEIEIRGPGALDLVQWVTLQQRRETGTVGQAHYSGLMTSRGTFVDDLLVHKISDTHYLLCVNAGNQDADFEHIVARTLRRRSRKRRPAIFAARNSRSARAGNPAAAHASRRSTRIRYYHFTFGKVERRRLPDRAHRLHRRRRLRNLFRSGTFRKTLERSDASRRIRRHDSLRPGRAQHAAPRSRHVPLRP